MKSLEMATLSVKNVKKITNLLKISSVGQPFVRFSPKKLGAAILA